MENNNWIIYGATGYTANLIIKKAIQMGLPPVLAGRDRSKISSVAKKYGLKYKVFEINDINVIQANIENSNLILNASSNYKLTAQPFINACLASGCHYLDLCGEISVLKKIFEYNELAKYGNITIIPNSGYHSIVTDCFAGYVANLIENPIELNYYLLDASIPSLGTLKSSLDAFLGGGFVLKYNNFENIKMGSIKTRVEHKNKALTLYASPMAELYLSHISTSIPNINVYLKIPLLYSLLLDYFGDYILKLLQSEKRTAILNLIDKFVKGPSEAINKKLKSMIGVNVKNLKGDSLTMWLEAPEAYDFTATLSVEAVKLALSGLPSGVLTPIQAYGCNFLSKFNDIKFFDCKFKTVN